VVGGAEKISPGPSNFPSVASLTYQTLASIDDLKFDIVEREKAEAALRELNETLVKSLAH
jgi:hypothetical protein